MNISNVAHAGLALLCQIVVALIAFAIGADIRYAAVMGGLLAVGFYWGREVAQSERKLGGKPWYVGFNMALWSEDALCDFLFPVVACTLAACGVFLLA